jgi:hypothetical protein
MNPTNAPMWLTALSVTMQLLPTVIVGIQHLMPGSSGEDKKAAVTQLAGAALAGTEAIVPKAAPAVDIVGNSVGSIIQGMYDLIMHKQPQSMQVHPDNTAPAPAPAAPAQQQPDPQVTGLG